MIRLELCCCLFKARVFPFGDRDMDIQIQGGPKGRWRVPNSLSCGMCVEEFEGGALDDRSSVGKSDHCKKAGEPDGLKHCNCASSPVLRAANGLIGLLVENQVEANVSTAAGETALLTQDLNG